MERDLHGPTDSGWLRRIACISTSRADSGIYIPLVAALRKKYETILLAGGSHVSDAFGKSLDRIDAPQDVRVLPVDHHVEGDDPASVCNSTARAIPAFAEALSGVQPELVFVLGDRTEMLGAAIAALILRLPIAHLHGGDLTLGAYDDACRHAITKLAHVHFPALTEHGKRIRSMGEEHWRIHVVGALALDGLNDFQPGDVSALVPATAVRPGDPLMVLIYHPETLSAQSVAEQMTQLLEGLASWSGSIVIFSPNADVGHQTVRAGLERFASSRGNCVMIASASRDDFWSVLARARLMVGNSSAGILEASSFGVPVVNIGDRQRGRVRAANVIDVRCEAQSIRQGIDQAQSEHFRRTAADVRNPYGDGRAAGRIMEALVRLPPRRQLLIKAGGQHVDEAGRPRCG